MVTLTSLAAAFIFWAWIQSSNEKETKKETQEQLDKLNAKLDEQTTLLRSILNRERCPGLECNSRNITGPDEKGNVTCEDCGRCGPLD